MVLFHYTICILKKQSLHFPYEYVTLCPVMKMKHKLRGSLALLFATILWGGAFVAQSEGMDHIGPFTFQAIRCFLAPAALIPLIALFELKDLKHFLTRWADPQLWKTGLICGIALFAATSLQQIGMVYTDAGKAGFITAMYIVLVPVIGMFLGQKPRAAVVFSIVMAVAGMYLLCCAEVSKISIGDLLILGGAVDFAVQITVIDRLCKNVDGLRLNCVQALVVAVLSAVFMVFTETPKWANILSCGGSLLYAGVLSMGIAYSLQIIGQKHIEPAGASLIMSLESVFAVLFGWLLLNEQLTLWESAGCVLVFAAVVLSQLPPLSRKAKKAVDNH